MGLKFKKKEENGTESFRNSMDKKLKKTSDNVMYDNLDRLIDLFSKKFKETYDPDSSKRSEYKEYREKNYKEAGFTDDLPQLLAENKKMATFWMSKRGIEVLMADAYVYTLLPALTYPDFDMPDMAKIIGDEFINDMDLTWKMIEALHENYLKLDDGERMKLYENYGYELGKKTVYAANKAFGLSMEEKNKCYAYDSFCLYFYCRNALKCTNDNKLIWQAIGGLLRENK